MTNDGLRYLKIANSTEGQMRAGLIKTGDKLPSLREISIDYKVSLNTAIRAYAELEDRGLVRPRAKSGYIVTRYIEF